MEVGATDVGVLEGTVGCTGLEDNGAVLVGADMVGLTPEEGGSNDRDGAGTLVNGSGADVMGRTLGIDTEGTPFAMGKCLLQFA